MGIGAHKLRWCFPVSMEVNYREVSFRASGILILPVSICDGRLHLSDAVCQLDCQIVISFSAKGRTHLDEALNICVKAFPAFDDVKRFCNAMLAARLPPQAISVS
jgi:hypothetical protein